ncbi:nucleoside-diphosphate kinase [Streptomyces solisilvae]|uniref:nucleoside-diphosphate kinase n=1 Tax=Streptomyces malaysiensis TaxID=92644 RepID=UPI00367543A9
MNFPVSQNSSTPAVCDSSDGMASPILPDLSARNTLNWSGDPLLEKQPFGPCPPYLIEDSYLAELGQGDAVWATVRRHIPEALITRLKECVFVMLKPDALQSGRHKEVLSEFARAGCFLLYAHTTLSASERHFEELYKYNLTIRNEHNMIGAWWINSPLYSISPSVALMFWIPPQGEITAHQQVKHLKGPANPFHGSPGELRRKAGGTNRALNLMHASDDPISTAREFLIFDSPTRLTAALQRADNLAQGKKDSAPLSNESLREQLFLAGPEERRLDLPSVLIGVKSRLRATEEFSEPLHEATADLYRRYRELSTEHMDIIARWERFCELSNDERLVLEKLAAEQLATVECLPLLRHLATPADYRYKTFEEIRVEFTRRDVSLDPWDELALATSLYYHDSFPLPPA